MSNLAVHAQQVIDDGFGEEQARVIAITMRKAVVARKLDTAAAGVSRADKSVVMKPHRAPQAAHSQPVTSQKRV